MSTNPTNPGTPPPSDAGTPPTNTPPSDGAGTSPEAWYSGLPEDLTVNTNITKYSNMEEFARGHLSAVGMIGKDKIVIPQSDVEFREAYKKLGMPETAADYTFEEKDYNLPENIYNKETQMADKEAFKNFAHEAGLNQKQSQLLYDRFMEYQVTSLTAMDNVAQTEMSKADMQMMEKWGEAKTANLEIANRALTKFFGQEVTDAVAASGLGRNFAFIEGMYKLGASSLEELGIDKRGFSAKTPDQLKDELASIQSHPAYFDSKHPEHQTLHRQALTIFERMEKQKSGL